MRPFSLSRVLPRLKLRPTSEAHIHGWKKGEFRRKSALGGCFFRPEGTLKFNTSRHFFPREKIHVIGEAND